MDNTSVGQDATKQRHPIAMRRKSVKRALAAASLLTAAAAFQGLAEPPAITQAVTPGTVSYQGQVQNADGSAYTDGVYGIEFRLYDAASAGTLLWGALYQPYLKNGFFNVILGQTGVGESPLTGCAYPAVEDFWKAVWIDPNNANKNRYLGLTIVNERGTPVGTPHESFPRQQLQASPFALQAQFAQQADSATRSPGDFTVATNLNVGTVTHAHVPRGLISMWSGALDAIPPGWALCDGSNGTPDLRSRFVLGAGPAYAVGAKGGAAAATLVEANMPPHFHSGTTAASGAHTHDWRGPTPAWEGRIPGSQVRSFADKTENYQQRSDMTVAAGDHTHAFTTDTKGSGTAFSILPPYYALAFIMKL
jgi:microcystin-dependent protein